MNVLMLLLLASLGTALLACGESEPRVAWWSCGSGRTCEMELPQGVRVDHEMAVVPLGKGSSRVDLQVRWDVWIVEDEEEKQIGTIACSHTDGICGGGAYVLAGDSGILDAMVASFRVVLEDASVREPKRICAHPAQVEGSPTVVDGTAICSAGTYQLGSLVFDVPEGVVFHIVFVGGGGALFKFGPCADEANFRNIVERSFATLLIREGEFIMIVYDGGVYGDSDGPPVYTYRTDGTAITCNVPTLEQIRAIARSLRIVESGE